ncbi:MAG: hypothetical protein WDM96_06120 [Lacunisphaera sp.]
MEDTGTLRALTNLTRAGRADVQRALVLRTASNFDLQPPDLNRRREHGRRENRPLLSLPSLP